MIGILIAWGVLYLEFPQGTDMSVFLENAFFMNLISSQIKHELTTLLTTAEAGCKTSICRSVIDVFLFICRKKVAEHGLYIKLQGH